MTLECRGRGPPSIAETKPPVSLERANHRKRWDAKPPAYGESHGGGIGVVFADSAGGSTIPVDLDSDDDLGASTPADGEAPETATAQGRGASPSQADDESALQ